MTTLVGALVVAAAGLLMGSGAWPFKLMKVYKFEHWWFVGMFVGLIVMPWAITLLGCPEPLKALQSVPLKAILLGNLFALGWGIANVLCGICYVRIGVALTGAILAGLGVSVGSIVPLVFKGSGLFQDAADLGSPAGITVLVAVAVMLVGVVIASLAGFGRDRALAKTDDAGRKGDFLGGLVMTVIAGILSSFMAFAFVYSQGPIVARFSRVEPGSEVKVTVNGRPDLSSTDSVSDSGIIVIGAKTPDWNQVQVGGLSAQEASERIAGKLGLSKPANVRVETGSIPATFAVYAIALITGALVNIGYAAYLLTRNRSWGVLAQSPRELILAVIIGIDFSLAATMNGVGMLLLGSLGASIGWGIQQAMQMTGTQALGFVSGEWKGVHGKPRVQMYVAIAIFIAASVIMAYGNTLAKN
jgi:L-rhamnose-proton symport protein (RhaT)